MFDLVDPEGAYNANAASDYELPFSVRPSKPVSVRDIMQINRDHYEGTQFDMVWAALVGLCALDSVLSVHPPGLGAFFCFSPSAGPYSLL